MKQPKNNFIQTNTYLKNAEDVEKYLASSLASSILVEGVTIDSPDMAESDLPYLFEFSAPSFKKLWE